MMLMVKFEEMSMTAMHRNCMAFRISAKCCDDGAAIHLDLARLHQFRSPTTKLRAVAIDAYRGP